MLKTLTAVAVMLAALFGSQMATSAHHDILKQGYDEASVSSDHKIGYVCDKEYDGNKVTASFLMENGDTVAISDKDGDGVEGPGDNGCWQLELPSPAIAMAVCEAEVYCEVDENI
jgi:hypothetical protein